ncbi:MAG: polymer-forming cytoskeletal protein [Anaerolineales bacterium]|nr:polymer-forming cytoskeletal protein [Anaerolineales bacterium]MCX7607647.1 polymer-forming cytoskeletal protein [Anaerolineales bacterium]
MMLKRNTPPAAPVIQPIERVTSVLGAGIIWQGNLSGSGGVRIEGVFEGQISLKGLLVIGETGKVTCENVRANNVIVAGALKGNITAQKVEIRSTGRVWGDITTMAFATEEGAFLRGQIRMEDAVDLAFDQTEPASPSGETSPNNLPPTA